MSDLRKAAEMALEALNKIVRVNAMDYEYKKWAAEAHETIQEALAQPEQEPVAIVNEGMGGIEWLSSPLPDDTALYAAPVDSVNMSQERVDETAKREHEWVGLTDEEKAWCGAPTLQETVARVEAKLKEKNT